jgi:hypothetical protein
MGPEGQARFFHAVPQVETGFIDSSDFFGELEVPSCIRCHMKGIQCDPFICQACPSLELCYRVQLIDYCVFSKWSDDAYMYKARWEYLKQLQIDSPGWVDLFHFSPEHSLRVTAQTFEPIDNDHTALYGKTQAGWKSVWTPPLFLIECKELPDYIQRCTFLCINESHSNKLLEKLWWLSRGSSYTLLPQALELWTANRLLMKGWQCKQSAGIDDPSSPYHLHQPAPRVLQNQLDQHIEAFVVGKEKKLTSELQQPVSKQSNPVDTFATALVLLLVIEKDIWRLLFWTKHISQDYKWRHPLRPHTLIDKSVFYARLLLASAKVYDSIAMEFQHVLRTSLPSGNESGLPWASPVIRYNEADDSSLDGFLLKYLLCGEERISELTSATVFNY